MTDTARSRVLILDHDLISPIGVGREETWTSLESDRLAGGPLRGFDTRGIPAAQAAEVESERLPLLLEYGAAVGEAIRADRKLELALAATESRHAQLQAILATVPESRRGIVFGMGVDIPSIDHIAEHASAQAGNPLGRFYGSIRAMNGGPERVSRLNRVANPLDLASILLARRFRLAAFQKTILTACSASLQAVAYGAAAIRRGDADFVLAGGADSLLNPVGFVAFSRLGIVSPSQPTAQACKPFDVNRDGVLIGEGSGYVLLASERGAELAGRDPAFELLGAGSSNDGYKITAPDPEGRGMARAMSAALRDAGILPADVGYVNLHGTGTRANDPAEAQAVATVFGEAAATLPISSTKDRHGHCIGGAGIVELGVLLESMTHGFVPCIRNLTKPIVEEGVWLVRGENLRRSIGIGMTNSFALGGVNCSVVVRNLARERS